MKFWKHPLIRNIGPDQFGNLFKTTPLSALSMLVNSTIMALALLQNVGWQETAIWWEVNILFAVYALYRWEKNKTKKVRMASKRAVKKLTITAFLFALPWAYLTIRYLGDLSHNAELILVAVVAGMSASGSIQLSRIYPAALTYLGVLTAAGVAKCLYLNTPEYYMLAVLILSYGLFLKHVVNNAAQLSIDRTLAIRSLKGQVDEMDRTKADLQRFAMEDPLTGLSNRRKFEEHLSSAIGEAKRDGSSVALLICDIDQFKNINDSSGHVAGDVVLTELANRLKVSSREFDLVARIGGDEFAIIAKHHQSPGETAEFARKLVFAISSPVLIEGNTIIPSMSIGISMFPYDAIDYKSILSHADLALQRGKGISRGQYYFFDQKMKSRLSSDDAMEDRLRQALQDEEFEVFYQPIVSISTGRPQGFEAMLRWRQSDGRLMKLEQFQSVAEDRGLIPCLSEFVVGKVQNDIVQWRNLGCNPGEISINIHSSQIKDENCMKRLVRDFERNSIDPRKINLEITECSLFGRGSEKTPAVLDHLRANGFRISLDEFGSGYASLTLLKNLPVDELKLDHSFVRDLLTDGPNREIVHAMVKLANSLGVKSIAEGVEKHEQHNVLLAIGCSSGQGDFYYQPLDFAQATKFLEDTNVDLQSRAAESNLSENALGPDPSRLVQKH